MSEPKFTKGKWRVVRQKDRYSDKCKLYVCYGEPDAVNPDDSTFPPDQCICGCGRSDQETEVNAALIAAAPEMYEMLEHIMLYVEVEFLHYEIKSLLAKARGENEDE